MHIRGIIKAPVNRVTINKRRDLQIEIKMNVLAMIEQTSAPDLTSTLKAEIYTHRQSGPVRRHPGAAGE